MTALQTGVTWRAGLTDDEAELPDRLPDKIVSCPVPLLL